MDKELNIIKIKEILQLKAKEIFSIDLHSLALFRIGLGLIIIIDLILRSRDLKAFYTDDGVLPRSLTIDSFINQYQLSIHFISGTTFIQSILFLTAVVFAFMLLIGYKTFISTLLSWFLYVSLINRNPLVFYCGDQLLKVLLFWSLFLPLGAKYSIDGAMHKKEEERYSYAYSAASVALLLQISFVYIVTALLKTGEEWRSNGTAIFYALMNNHYSTSLGLCLCHFPALLKLLTPCVLLFEFLGPIFLFIPFYTKQIRTIIIALFLLLQAGFGFFLSLGIFPWISTVAIVPFLPGSLSKKILSYFKHQFEQILLFKPKQSYQTNKSSFISPFSKNVLAAFFFIYILIWNLWTINPQLKIPTSFWTIGNMLGINQRWDMFAPYPFKTSGWYVIPGKLLDGSESDIIKDGEPITWEKPKIPSQLYKSYRWNTYLLYLWHHYSTKQFNYFGRYICREWNSTHTGGSRLNTFKIYYMEEKMLPDFSISKPEAKLLWSHHCF